MNHNLLLHFWTVMILSSLNFQISFAQTNEALESVTIDEIKNHMYFLASDFMKGRVSYEPEYEIAAEYVASQFLSAGLKPILKDESGLPTYFQNVPLIVKKFGKDISLKLIKGNVTTDLIHIQDFKIPVMMSDNIKDEIECVFIGYGIKEEKYNWNDFEDLDIEGKALFMLMGAPTKKGEAIFPKDVYESYSSISGIDKKLLELVKMDPAAIVILADDNFLKSMPWEYLPSLDTIGKCFYDGGNNNLSTVIPPIFVVKPEVQDHIFGNSISSPSKINEKGISAYKTFHFKDLKIEMSFEVLDKKSINAKNIIAIVEGSDPKLKDEYITVGAHLDHLPLIDGKIFNGADDNASGTIGVLESSEAMRLSPPKRSVMYILYAAEELGLFGSSHFVNNPPVPIEKIKFNINLDMIGRSILENEKLKTHRVVIYDDYFKKIKQFVELTNESTINWSLDFINMKNKNGDSDHTSFHRKGIPSFQFASGHHADYHRPTDDAENIDFEKLQKITQLTYIIAYRLANLEEINFK